MEGNRQRADHPEVYGLERICLWFEERYREKEIGGVFVGPGFGIRPSTFFYELVHTAGKGESASVIHPMAEFVAD